MKGYQYILFFLGFTIGLNFYRYLYSLFLTLAFTYNMQITALSFWYRLYDIGDDLNKCFQKVEDSGMGAEQKVGSTITV